MSDHQGLTFELTGKIGGGASHVLCVARIEAATTNVNLLVREALVSMLESLDRMNDDE